MTKQEEQWEIESDACVLRKYAKITAAEARLAAAIEHLNKEAKLLDSAISGFRNGGLI